MCEKPDGTITGILVELQPAGGGVREVIEVSLAGKLYPKGIPIFPEEELTGLIERFKIDEVVFSYSDVSFQYVMEKASLVMAHGADFKVLGSQHRMIRSSKPVIAVVAVRTGSGKSQTSRKVCGYLHSQGLSEVEYYLYNDKGMMGAHSNLGSNIAVDSVVNINSGLMDSKRAMVLSYLHKAIKPLNNLRMMEDATVIYRLSRAPERRIFYVDVGNMPTIKAEQYLRDIMVKYRNKLVYDSRTGEIKDDRKHLSMLEDFWLPRREGSKGTEITTLPGGQNLGQMDDVKYFEEKLYKALGIPISRLQQQQGFSLGRTTEITRDELKFTKFIQRFVVSFHLCLMIC